MLIGVLALQGDFKEHRIVLQKLRVKSKEIRMPEDLQSIGGLIIPGGESTVMGNLMRKSHLDSAIKEKSRQCMPIYGTCAGAILLAKDIIDSGQPRLGLADISIRRNAYGSQPESFEDDIKAFGKTMHVAFIRAPQIVRCGPEVKILAAHGESPVLVRQEN